MKATYFALFAVAAFALVKADTTTPNPLDSFLKQLSESLETAAKKFQEVSGIHTEYDKEKFVTQSKALFTKYQEKLAGINDAFSKDTKPISEEVKKTLESVSKQINETLKALNSPDTQAKFQKLQETVNAGAKKIFESLNDLAKSAGLSPQLAKGAADFFEESQKFFQKLQEKANELLKEALKKKA